MSSFFSAIATGWKDGVRRMIENNPSVLNTLDPYTSRHPLYFAIAFSRREMFEMLYHEYPQYKKHIHVWHTDRYGLHLIDYAWWYDSYFSYGRPYTSILLSSELDEDKIREWEIHRQQRWNEANARHSIPLHRHDDESDHE